MDLPSCKGVDGGFVGSDLIRSCVLPLDKPTKDFHITEVDHFPFSFLF